MDDALFWSLIAKQDWTKAGDDDAVVEPVVAALAAMSEDDVQSFHERLAEKLHALDGRAWARESGSVVWWGEPSSLSVDGFLYSRCVVVADGKQLYDHVLANPAAMPKDVEFEALLYVTMAARERQTGDTGQLDTVVSYETFANRDGWR